MSRFNTTLLSTALRAALAGAALAAPTHALADDDAASVSAASTHAVEPGLNIVEMAGPVRADWLRSLRAHGIEPVHYIGGDRYLVWIDDMQALERLATLGIRSAWLRSVAGYGIERKLDSALPVRLRSAAAPDEELDVLVQVFRHAHWEDTRRSIEALARVPTQQQGPLGNGIASITSTDVLGYVNLGVRLRLDDIERIALLPDVTFIGPKLAMRLLDEKQNLIMAGHLSPDSLSPNYLDWLLSLGFSENPDDYPIVDVVDSAVHEGGSGATVLNTADEMLHVGGDVSAASRVVSFHNCSNRPDVDVFGTDGHGSLGAGIVAGWDQSIGWPWQDQDGHRLGLGVNPFGRIASTAIFTPSFDVANCGGDEVGLIRTSWLRGAGITTNSWGSEVPPADYEFGAQIYDVGVRDADLEEPGNQELTIVFSAGNSGSGSGTIGAPGTGKNVITIGASENLRPQWTDGCGAGPFDANNPQDIARFSSRGPAPGQRVKPEMVAPGTHIQARASIHPSYVGGVCDPFYPQAQTIFAASSGTSHSTPAVAGLASLSWFWIEQGGHGSIDIDTTHASGAPSPAAMKGWLLAHPLWLDGASSGDRLPSNAQGYGMPNMALMFDDTRKAIVDQTHVFRDSGEQWQATWAVADPALPVRLVLTWTDAPGMLGTTPQVNDLDLIVDAGETQRWHGNHFAGAWSDTGGSPDRRNNYEAVYLPAGTADTLDITVDAHTVAGLGVPGADEVASQDFALVCYNCIRQPEFRLATPEPRPQACVTQPGAIDVELDSILGFSQPVALSATSDSPGLSFSFAEATVSPPASTQLLVTADANAVVGQHELRIDAESGLQERSLTVPLSVYAQRPAAPTQIGPAAAAVTGTQPTFVWSVAAQAHGYRLEVATDPEFVDVVVSVDVADAAWTVPADRPLDSSRRHWWRVTAVNACGDSLPPSPHVFADGLEDIPAAIPEPENTTSGRMFVTAALPGDCPVDVPAVVLFDDTMENDSGWLSGAANGNVDTWRRSGERVYSGNHAWQAGSPASSNDQWLVSPPLSLPSDLQTLALKFRNHRTLAAQGNSCLDGVALEVRVDDGAWTPLDAGVLSDPYDGHVAGLFGNPLAGRATWCGTPAAWRNTVVDMQPYAGRDVQLRFRLGSDNGGLDQSVAWALDDVRVTACPAD